MLVAGRGLDRGDDLSGDAQLGEAAERRLFVGPEVADRLVEPDQPLLDQILGLAAGKEIRAGLEPDEAGIAANERVERGAVAVPRTQRELEILKLTLSFVGGNGGLHGLDRHVLGAFVARS